MRLPAGTYHVNYVQDMGIVQTIAQWAVLVLSLAALFTFPLYGSSYLHLVKLNRHLHDFSCGSYASYGVLRSGFPWVRQHS